MFTTQLMKSLEERCPEAVMMRGVLENALPPDVVDRVFDEHREGQYQRDLLFSTVVNVLGAAVFKVHRSVNSACRAYRDEMGASIRALFAKMNRTEIGVSAGLVDAAYQRMAAVVDRIGSSHPPLFPALQTRILDGNHLAATEHRLSPLRRIGGGALPGVAVAVLDRERELFHSVALARDAYTQERLLALDLIGRAQSGELWIGDRNFCTSAIVWQLNYVGAKYLIRRHASNVRFESVGRRKHFGRTDTGVVYEQSVRIFDDHGQSIRARLIRIELTEPTRDGDHAIELLTNLSKRYPPMRIADAYRERWQIETNFAHVEKLFDGEIPTLSDPRAALLAFCLALIAWNAVALLKAALRKKHGAKPINEELSMYYLADTILRHTQGMKIFEEKLDWAKRFATLTPRQLARDLTRLASGVDLTRLKKNIRSPKKRLPKPKAKKNKPHFSTARVLQAAT